MISLHLHSNDVALFFAICGVFLSVWTVGRATRLWRVKAFRPSLMMRVLVIVEWTAFYIYQWLDPGWMSLEGEVEWSRVNILSIFVLYLVWLLSGTQRNGGSRD